MPGDIWLTFPDGKEHELKESVTIGRDDSNDLTFTSATVSRDHAALTFTDGRWYVEDRGSFNGTFLNGTRVQPGTPLPLRHADRISSPGQLSWRTRTQPNRSKRSRPPIPRSCPRSSARSCSPCADHGSRAQVSRAFRRTSRSPHSSGHPARREPSKPHSAASTQRPGSRISRHTRSVAHSVASHASAAGSRKTAREHAAPSRPLRSSCQG